ncbi:MAG: CDP-diacylglycerol--glycerol-3-phosphate 3-phosphatidyltransferase [Planctomycetota bacterium]|jgi:CDP-diacylglycerol--glycerol-3-phosphate 3-phosphatidyltransferase
MSSSEAQNESSPAAPTQPAPIDHRSLNLPNLITLSRLVLAFVLFGLISYEGFWVTASILFVVAATTDAIDGYLARRNGQVTTLGRILDPFVDKIIICGAFIFLLQRPDRSGVNAWMVTAVVGREMFVTGLRSFLEQAGKDFSAVWIGKVKMVLQCVAVTVALLTLSPDFREGWMLRGRDVVLWIAVGITVYSGASYAWRGFLMLKPQSK